jgi:hypothetical protein
MEEMVPQEIITMLVLPHIWVRVLVGVPQEEEAVSEGQGVVVVLVVEQVAQVLLEQQAQTVLVGVVLLAQITAHLLGLVEMEETVLSGQEHMAVLLALAGIAARRMPTVVDIRKLVVGEAQAVMEVQKVLCW